MTTTRTRFAPSPTGYMHIGNLRTALFGYLFARATGGTFILRIEDTDRQRLVPDAVKFITDSLAAAHITVDEGYGVGGDFGPYVQSERRDIYRRWAEWLVEHGHAYRCFCDQAATSEDNVFGGYNRHCRDLDEAAIAEHLRNGDPYVIRQKMPLSGSTSFHDYVHGSVAIPNSELEDQVLLKRDGLPTYNFANVVDDHLMRITHVIRGTEYITSTPKHVLLYEAFGWELPVFVHPSPVMGKNPDGTTSKLSKRHGATSFAELVRLGYLPEAIVNYIALLGWSPGKSTQELFSLDELQRVFSLDGLSKSPAVFDFAKLDWFNGEYFKQMSDFDFCRGSHPFAEAAMTDELKNKWLYASALLRTRVSKYSDVPAMIAFFRELPDYDLDLFVNKKSKATLESALAVLPIALRVLGAVPGWTPYALEPTVKGLMDLTKLKTSTVMWALRVALSGQKATPGGVTELLYLLGQGESLERLRKALDKLRAAVVSSPGT